MNGAPEEAPPEFTARSVPPAAGGLELRSGEAGCLLIAIATGEGVLPFTATRK